MSGTSGRRRRKPASSAVGEDGRKHVNLALQGGGSHGAYTWGVLDALLEDGRIGFEAITGASAGAINAVLLAEGWRRGLAEGADPCQTARERLTAFWTALGTQPNPFSLVSHWHGATAMLPGGAINPMAQSLSLWLDIVSRVWSPYQLNPWNINPLRVALSRHVDFDALRAAAPMKLFLCATNVRTGRVRIFRESELQLEMPLASACLPFVFQAVEIAHEHGTEAYWDGGYLGNPALWPLFYGTTSSDLLLVQINPLARAEVPDTAPEIAERVSEISFNASLLHEMRAIEFVQRLLAEKKLDPGRYRRVFLHRIASETQMAAFGASSKYDTSAPFLRRLFDLGRAAGHDWLERHYHYVGHAGTVRIAEQYL